MDTDDLTSNPNALPHALEKLKKSTAVPLKVVRYRLIFDGINSGVLPAYAGSTWRGAFGWALKKSVCIAQGSDCKSCLLQSSCAYSYLFESAPPSQTERMRKYSTIPAPYVLKTPQGFSSTAQNHAHYSLGLTLFGKANDYLPNIIHAMMAAAQAGLGKTRQPCELIRVTQETLLGNNQWNVIYAPSQPLAPTQYTPPILPTPAKITTLNLLTPLRLRVQEKYVTPEQFHFAQLFSNVLRRISSLCYFHGKNELIADFRALTHSAKHVNLLSQELDWADWARYSSRQKKRIKMGGLIGTLTLNSAEIAPYWPYLWLGQWTHAGKGTTMGLGKYRMTTR